MAVPTDLRTLCSALEHFQFPAALGSIGENRLMIWNESFRQMAELSERELAEVSLGSLIALDESYEGLLMQNGDWKNWKPHVLPGKEPGRTSRKSDG